LLNDPLLNNELDEMSELSEGDKVAKIRTAHYDVGKREIKEITNHDGSRTNIILASLASLASSLSATTMTDDRDSVIQSKQIPTPVTIITVTTKDYRDGDVGADTEDADHYHVTSTTEEEDHRDDNTDNSGRIQSIDGKNDEKHEHGVISTDDELCDDKLHDVTITPIGIEIEHLEEDKEQNIKDDVKNENENENENEKKKNKYWKISNLFRTTKEKDYDEKESGISECGTTMVATPLSIQKLDDCGVRSNDESELSSGVQQQTYNEKTLGLAQSSTKKPIKLPEMSFEDRLINFVSLAAANRDAQQFITTVAADDEKSIKSTEREKDLDAIISIDEILFTINTPEEEDVFNMFSSAEKDEVWNRDVTNDENEKQMIVKDVVKDSSPILGLVGATTTKSTTSVDTDKTPSIPESPASCSNSKTKSMGEECNMSTTSSMTESIRSTGVSIPSMPTELPSRVDSKASTDKNTNTQQDKKSVTNNKPSSEMITLKNNTTDNIMKKNTQRTKIAATTTNIFMQEQKPQQKQRTQKDNIMCAKSIEKDVKKTKKSDRRSTAKAQKSTNLFGNKDTEGGGNEKKKKTELSSASPFGTETKNGKRKERKTQMSTTLFGKDTEEVKYKERKAELSTTLFGGNRQKNQQQQQKRSKKKASKTSTERKTKELSQTLF
jgi:hypothetical protein